MPLGEFLLIHQFLQNDFVMKALIFGAGGAGDCISAILAMNYYKKLGYETILGSIIWERYVIDPVPGPINFEDLRNAVKFNDCIYFLIE